MGRIGTNETIKVTIKHKLHYAWVILIAAGVLSVVSRADAASFGVFIDPLVKLYGWSRGEVSLSYSLAFLSGVARCDWYGLAGRPLRGSAANGGGFAGDSYGHRTPRHHKPTLAVLHFLRALRWFPG